MSILPRRPRDLRLLPFRGSQAISAGLLTTGQLRGAAWRRILPDVYVAADVEMDHRLWCVAATIFGRDRGAVSGRNAARMWGFGLFDQITEDAPIELTLPIGVSTRPLARVRVVHSPLAPTDVVHLHGVSLTSELRTAFDLARRLEFVDGVIIVDAMLRKRLFWLDELAGYAANRPDWHGARRAERVIGTAEPLSESPMETRLRLVVVAGGLPRPVAQFKVYDDAGRFLGRLDLAYPDLKIGIEYEGDHHREPEHFRADVRRVQRLHAGRLDDLAVHVDRRFPQTGPNRRRDPHGAASLIKPLS